MVKTPIYKDEIIFQEVDGLWVAVDSACQTPPTLEDIMSQLNIIIDEDCQFCRIIRQNGKIKKTIEYRAYGGKVRLNITQVKEE